MPNIIITPKMNLPNPVVSTDPGPDYGNNIYASFVLVDQHNHTPGYGAQIPPGGLDINSDLTFQSNNATNVRSVRFTDQGSPLALVTDIGCIYESNGDLWYNDSSGTQIRITATGAVNATISALVSGLNRASFIANQLVVESDSSNSTPGNIVVGSVLLGNNLPSSNFLTLEPPNAMPTNYTLTLPSLPANTQVLQIDSSGNITASGVSPAAINPSGSIIMYGGVSAPTGYLLCDGTSYLRSAQPSLFSAIGTAYGTVDGTHFNVPDFRGMFPRGVANGSGNDPDAITRTAAAAGGNTGDNVGSAQAWQIESHIHGVISISGAGATPANLFAGGSSPSTQPTTAYGGNQTNPINLFVNFIIKT